MGVGYEVCHHDKMFTFSYCKYEANHKPTLHLMCYLFFGNLFRNNAFSV